MPSVESSSVNKGMGRGSSWSSLDLESLESHVSSGQVGGCHRQGRWGSSEEIQLHAMSAVLTSVRRQSSQNEMHEFIEEEHGRVSVKLETSRFTLCRTSSRKALRYLRPLVICTVPHPDDRHTRDRRKFDEETLARLALASGRRISRKIAANRLFFNALSVGGS